MHLPQFTAEASLGRARERYTSLPFGAGYASNKQRITAQFLTSLAYSDGPCPHGYDLVCYLVGDQQVCRCGYHLRTHYY